MLLETALYATAFVLVASLGWRLAGWFLNRKEND